MASLMVDVERALKLLTPGEGSVMIGLDAESARQIKHLLISTWLKGEGELPWQPTLAQLKMLLRRIAPRVNFTGDASMLADGIRRVVEAAFTGAPEHDPEDIARLRYQLRYIQQFGQLDIADDADISDEGTDPGV